MLISAENKEGEKICHIFQQRRSLLALKWLKAGRCRLHLPGFEDIYQDQGVQQSLLHQTSFGWYTIARLGFQGVQQSLLHQPSYGWWTIARLVHLRHVHPLWIQKKVSKVVWLWRPKVKKAATYSPALHCSTIGASGLNFSVRNGKRWDTAAITA